MIARRTHVSIVEFEAVRYPRTDIVAVALCEVDGVQVEPLPVTLGECGELAVRADACVEVDGSAMLDLHAIFGGAEFESVPEPARRRLLRLVRDRAYEVLDGGES